MTSDAEAPAVDRAAALRDRLIRNFMHAPRQEERRDPLYESLCTRLATGTAAQKLGASIDTVAPGKRSCPYHFHHAQEEMFVVLEGEASLRVAGEMLPIQAGDVIFIPPGPAYPHQIVNTSERPVTYLSVSTRDSPEIVEYPDSGKYLATGPRDAEGRGFESLRHAGGDVDYWEGEP